MTIGLDWRQRAACRSVSPDLFFPREDEGHYARELRELGMVSASCPVTGLDGLCADYAIRTGDRWLISG